MDDQENEKSLPALIGAAHAEVDGETKPVESGPIVAVDDVAEEPTRADRAAALIDGYTHAMATNSPRTIAELEEIKALLGE